MKFLPLNRGSKFSLLSISYIDWTEIIEKIIQFCCSFLQVSFTASYLTATATFVSPCYHILYMQYKKSQTGTSSHPNTAKRNIKMQQGSPQSSIVGTNHYIVRGPGWVSDIISISVWESLSIRRLSLLFLKLVQSYVCLQQGRYFQYLHRRF